MPKYIVPFTYTVAGSVEIEAEDAEHAIDLAYEVNLPEIDVDYVDDSFFVDVDYFLELNEG